MYSNNHLNQSASAASDANEPAGNAVLLIIAMLGSPYLALGHASIRLLQALGELVIAGVMAVLTWTANLCLHERLTLGFACTCALLICSSVCFAWLTLPSINAIPDILNMTSGGGTVDYLRRLLAATI